MKIPTLIVLALLIAPLVGWAIHRDIRRAVARRRQLRRLREFGSAVAAAGIGAAFGQSMAQVVTAAQDFERTMRQVQVTLTADTSAFEAAIRRAQRAAAIGKETHRA